MKSLGYIACLSTLVLLSMYSCSHHRKGSKTPTEVAKKPSTTESDPDAEASEKTTGTKATALTEKYAGILGVKPAEIQNEALYRFINDWYGVPYKYAGKDKKGIDCSGFSSLLYTTVYHKKLSPSSKAQAEETKKVASTDLQEGDLVFFDINAGRISHVGVYLQNNKFVHASTKRGVIINDLNEPYYKKYFVRSGRPK